MSCKNGNLDQNYLEIYSQKVVNLKNILLNLTRHWVREGELGNQYILSSGSKPPLCNREIYYALNLIFWVSRPRSDPT